jgi:TPR repeat protein
MELFENSTEELDLEGLEGLGSAGSDDINDDGLQNGLADAAEEGDVLDDDGGGTLDVTALYDSTADSSEEDATAEQEDDCNVLDAEHNAAPADYVEHHEPREEMLYDDTVQLMQSGEIDVADGIKLLRRAAELGCDRSWLYLGQLYSHKKSAMYNPALAFECYKNAAELGNGEGCYNL